MSTRRDHTNPRPPSSKHIPDNRTNKYNLTLKSSSPEHKTHSNYHNQHKLQLSNSRSKKQGPEAVTGTPPKEQKDDILLRREKEIMSRLLRTKMEEGRRRRWRTEHGEDRLVLRKHTIAGFDNLEFEVLKPTDKLFQRLENMRLAEKILLARPSLELNRSNLSTFYKRQKSYLINIRRMPARHDNRPNHRPKKQWLD